MGRLAAAALIAVAIAGCRTPVALRTAAAQVDACDGASTAGLLVPSPQSGLAVQSLITGETVEVLWPFGYSATRDVDGSVTLHDPSGKDLVVEGETITMGGSLDADGVWAACAGTVLSAPGI